MENKKSFWASKSGMYTITVILYIIILPTILWLSTSSSSDIVTLIIGGIGAIFGWKALNKIQPDVFLIMPVVGWLIFFLVKLILSFIIGIFVMPFVIAKKISSAISESVEIANEQK